MADWRYGCIYCSTVFGTSSMIMGEFNNNPSRLGLFGIIRLFKNAYNVVDLNRSGDYPIMATALNAGEEGRNCQVVLSKIYCQNCEIHCGWRISATSESPQIHEGYSILQSTPINVMAPSSRHCNEFIIIILFCLFVAMIYELW